MTGRSSSTWSMRTRWNRRSFRSRRPRRWKCCSTGEPSARTFRITRCTWVCWLNLAGEEALKVHLVALLVAEAHALVVPGVAQELHATDDGTHPRRERRRVLVRRPRRLVALALLTRRRGAAEPAREWTRARPARRPRRVSASERISQTTSQTSRQRPRHDDRRGELHDRRDPDRAAKSGSRAASAAFLVVEARCVFGAAPSVGR